MSIASTTNRNNYTGNGSTNEYDYTFRIFDDDDLLVTVRDTDDVETTLIKTTDYTVDGVGLASGGSITLVNSGQAWLTGANLTTGIVLSIRRKLPLTQNTDIRNQGDFFPEAHEDQFDRSIMIDQQQQDELDRSIKLSETIDPTDFDPTIPPEVVGANNLSLVINATGDGFAVGPTTTEISSAQGFAVSAQDWAVKTDGIVETTDYSSKAWAIGGTGVTDTATRGAAKEWAIETSSTVDTSEYSAKEYAVGVQRRGLAGGGSAKDWAIYTAGTVDDTGRSAKYWAEDAQATAQAISTDLTTINNRLDDIEEAVPAADSYLQLEEQVTPPTTPAAGFHRIYVDSDGVMYRLDPSGVSNQIGSGGGGAGLEWYFGESNAPFEAVLSNGLRVLDFAQSPDELEMFCQLVVPSTFVAGTQIKLTDGKLFASATTGNVLFRAQTVIMKAAVDATSSPTAHLSTNTQVAVSGTTNNIVAVGDVDLTNSNGEINSVAVQPGDVLLVKLFRDTSAETSGLAGDARLLRGSFQPKFTV